MIVILNGPSSAGKTTLSHALRSIWPKPLYYFSYDATDWTCAPFAATGRDFPDPERPVFAVAAGRTSFTAPNRESAVPLGASSFLS